MDIGKAISFIFEDPDWLKKVAIGVGLTLLGIIFSVVLIGLIPLIIVTGYFLNMGVIAPKLDNRYIDEVLLKEIEKNPDNPNLYLLLGDLYYKVENWEGTREAYEAYIAPKNVPQLGQFI